MYSRSQYNLQVISISAPCYAALEDRNVRHTVCDLAFCKVHRYIVKEIARWLRGGFLSLSFQQARPKLEGTGLSNMTQAAGIWPQCPCPRAGAGSPGLPLGISSPSSAGSTPVNLLCKLWDTECRCQIIAYLVIYYICKLIQPYKPKMHSFGTVACLLPADEKQTVERVEPTVTM